MKVCLLGDFSADLDEGFKNISHHLAAGLEARNELIRVDVKRLWGAGFWDSISNNQPQFIHTIAQPTDQSLLFTKMLKLRWPSARTVVSALRPDRFFKNGTISPRQELMIQFARPDLVLVQSSDAEEKFKSLGCPVKYLSNGVDLQRFKPASKARKHYLRRKYGLPSHQPVVLHVGHLETARNLTALLALPMNNIQVVVAGSVYMGVDIHLLGQLQDAGFTLFEGYQPHIEELFMLADCYVFPVRPGNSISMPLSVLEAMACNLPVLTTRFQGLTNFFDQSPSLKYIDNNDDLLESIKSMLCSSPSPTTRQMVSAYSWDSVVNQLEDYYCELST
jgi:glycosyltransferase involved in cell wall biosynthesis